MYVLENYNKILTIQTAFIGDVILATSLLETLQLNFPNTKIDIVVRKGNESLFKDHPFINKIYVWDKKNPYVKKHRRAVPLLAEVIRSQKAAAAEAANQ